MFSAVLLAMLGPGSEIRHDCGFWNMPAGQPGRTWTSIPRPLVLVGIESEKFAKEMGRGKLGPCFVFVDRDRPTEGFHLLSRKEITWHDVVKIKTGGELAKYNGSDLSLPIREEPPDGLP